MTELKWRPYPETMPQLPVEKWNENNKILVTVLYKDGTRRVDWDCIKSDGKWMRYSGSQRAKVIAWMYIPAPYVREPDQQSLF